MLGFTSLFSRAHADGRASRHRWLSAAIVVGLLGGLIAEVPATKAAAATSMSPAALPGLPVAAQAAPRTPWKASPVDAGLGSKPWQNYKPVAKGPENTSERGKYATVYDNSDGTHTVSLSTNPVHFQDDAGKWKTIDSTVIADPDNAGSFRSKANSWTARFGASGFSAAVGDKTFTMSPSGGAASVPTLDDSGRVVYPNVWPGVDVRYTVGATGVEQDLVVRQLGGSPNFAFDTSGLTLTAGTRDGVALENADQSVVVGNPVVQDKSGKDVDAAAPMVGANDAPSTKNVSGSAFSTDAAAPTTEVAPSQQMSVTVNAAWWASLTSADLPVTIDPSITLGDVEDEISFQQSYRADGTTTDPDLKIGNPTAGGTNYWRDVTTFDWSNYFGSHVLSAALNLYRTAGTANAYQAGVANATATSYVGAGTTPLATGLFGNTGTISSPTFTGALDSWIFGKINPGLAITGLESSGTASWKEGYATLDLALNTPPTPAVAIGPADGSVLASTTPTLAVLPSTDADGETVTYRFQVGTGADGTTGVLWDSGFQSNRNVVVPSSVQWKDGTTYTWRVDTKDSFGLTSPYPLIRHFRFDRRLGDDPTQTYDTEGPVKVDLATGNLLTGVSTPTIATVAGPAGVKLSYNSFAESRAVSDTGVPQGWRLEAGAGLGYTNARIDATTGSVVLVDGTGVTHEYKKDATNNSFTPPLGELGVLASIDTGGYSLSDSDGTTYVFDASGVLQSATTADDDKKPAALIYNYTGSLLSSVKDPVRNTNVVTVTYQGGSCPTAPTGFDGAPPTGAVCQVALLDGRVTKIFYINGRLARVENPGADVTDFGYDTYGNMTRVRDSMQADWVAAVLPSLSRDTDYARTLITYDSTSANAKVTRVQLAAPDGTSATAALRPDRSFTYRTSTQTNGFYAYDPAVQSGVDVAVGELNSSSAGQEIVTGTAQNADPAVAIHSPSGTYLGGFYAFTLGFQAGIRVAVGDVDPTSPGNEIVVGTNGGTPYVAVYTATGQLRGGFYAYDSAGTYGTDVAVGDVDGDGVKEIITGAGLGGGPNVRVWRFSGGSSSGTGTGSQMAESFVYDGGFTGGVRVTTMDTDGDGRDEIVTAPQAGGGPHVRELRYPDYSEVRSFWGVDPSFNGGIDVGGASGRDGLAVTTLSQDAALMTPADGSYLQLPFGVFTGGMRAAMGDIDNDGALDIVVGAGPMIGGGPHVRTFSPSGVTDVSVAGLTPPSGYAHRVVYDGALRTYEDRDAAGRDTHTTWDPVDDKVLATTDPAGRRTTTVYDANDRPTAQYGPAPARWFNGAGVPVTNPSQVPTTTTAYDTNSDGSPMLGLAAAYWNNTSFSGAPVLHGTGDGDSTTGDLNRDWSTGGPGSPVNTDNFGARFTGTFTLSATDNYTIQAHVDDGIRVWVDGVKVLDNWAGGLKDLTSTAFWNAYSGQTHSIRVDYAEFTGNAVIALAADALSDGIAGAPIMGMRPNYGLPTSSTVVDGGSSSPSVTTTTSYTDPVAGIGPELGLPTVVTTGGLATATTYETPGVGYLRRTKRTLPVGNATTYANYSATDTAAPPAACGGGTAVLQGGLAKSSTSPSSTLITNTTVYDVAGRPVSSTEGSLTSCITYDTRGRVATRAVPAGSVDPARTVTYGYAVATGGYTTTVADVAGTITTEVDLLGRATRYTDVYGNVTTTTYDQVGRPVESDGPQTGAVDLTHVDYDSVGQVADQKINNVIMATPTYNAAGELTQINYPTGTGNGGNGTIGTISRDNFGQTTDLNWWKPGPAQLTFDHVTRSQSGRVVDESIDVSDAYTAGPNFIYDTAGRLSVAAVANKITAYTYAASGGCGSMSTAGMNSNRSQRQDWTTDSVGANPVAAGTSNSCYNNSDQLTSGDDAAPIVYDALGNTRRLGAQALGYDGADRNTSLASVNDAVKYTRDATDRIVARTTTTIGQRTTPYGSAATNGTGSTSLSIPKVTGTAAGDVMVAEVVTNSSSASVTAPSGWTLVSGSQVANGTGLKSQVYWKTATASEPTNFTWTFGSSVVASGGMQAYTGVDTTTPVETSATAATSLSSVHSEPSITPTTDGAKIVEMVAKTGNGNFTAPPAGMTWQAAVQNGLTTGVGASMADRMVGTKDPTSASGVDTWTITGTASVGVVTALALRPATSTTVRYGYSGDGDTPDITQTSTGTIVESNMSLLGGAMLTIPPAGPSAATWSYPNIHGDTAAVANNVGAKIGSTYRYDAFGNALSTGVPDNATGTFDYGWLGSKQRGSEHPASGGTTIEMGARPYNPLLGRFLRIDPIEGGSANNYDYAYGDCQNKLDLDGRAAFNAPVAFKTEVLFGPCTASQPATRKHLKFKKVRIIAQVGKGSTDVSLSEGYVTKDTYVDLGYKGYEEVTSCEGGRLTWRSYYEGAVHRIVNITYYAPLGLATSGAEGWKAGHSV